MICATWWILQDSDWEQNSWMYKGPATGLWSNIFLSTAIYIYRSQQHSEHNDFIWQRTKSWKKCLAWFKINNNQHLQPNLTRETRCLKIESHIQICNDSALTGQASIFDLNLSNLLLKIIIYCVTSNAITCINKRFAVKNSAVCCLTLICIWK